MYEFDLGTISDDGYTDEEVLPFTVIMYFVPL